MSKPEERTREELDEEEAPITLFTSSLLATPSGGGRHEEPSDHWRGGGPVAGLPLNGRAESIAMRIKRSPILLGPVRRLWPQHKQWGNGGFFVDGGESSRAAAGARPPLPPALTLGPYQRCRTGILPVGPRLGSGVFTGNGGPLTTIASGPSTSFGIYTSINNAGAVAFFAAPVGGQGIFGRRRSNHHYRRQQRPF